MNFFSQSPSITKAGIIEDEAACADELEELLSEHFPDIQVCFIAKSLKDAKACIQSSDIDLLFLDVHLTDGSGFDILSLLNDRIRVIFTTAFDHYAVRAFEVNALDYLLKPVQKDRLERAIQVFSDPNKRNRTLPPTRADDDLLLREDGHSKLVPVREIQYIESDGDYTRIFTKERNWYIRKSLNYWENKLPTLMFVRIHRSILINVDHVSQSGKDAKGRIHFRVKASDVALVSSRRYSNRLKKFYGTL
jgi:two-component system LytT family response regulator